MDNLRGRGGAVVTHWLLSPEIVFTVETERGFEC